MEGEFEREERELGVPVPGSLREQWGQAERLILSGLKPGDHKKASRDLRFLHDQMIAENR